MMRALTFPLIKAKPLMLIIALGYGMSAQALTFTGIEERQVIELKAERFQRWLGEDVQDYQLAAIKKGRFQPIPFQIDEVDINGDVFFEEMEVPIDGTQNIVDPNDRLLFMLRDAGPKRTNELPDGKPIAEIQVPLESGEQAYVYLLKGSRLSSDTMYVRYASELGRVETDYYTLTMSSENALNWDDFQYHGFSGPQSSPLDTLKLRLQGGLILPFPRFTWNNKNFVARPIVEKVGPIRATNYMRTTFYMFGVPLIPFHNGSMAILSLV